MGFDVLRFVNSDDINEDLICNICKGVLEEGVWAPNCEHAFCKVCINKWLSRRNICPNDRQHLSHGLLKAIPRFMRNILDKLEIKCEFVTNGCLQTMSMEALRQHICECDYNPEKRVECESGCGEVVKKADLQSHNCVKTLRKKVNELIEDNMNYHQMVTSVRLDMNSLRNENKRINELVNNLRIDVRRLSAIVEKQTVISDASHTPTPKSERHSRVVPNPYVLITPLQPSHPMSTCDEPSSSTLGLPSPTRLDNNEPVFKRRTTIRVNSSYCPMASTISSSIVRSFSPSYSSPVEDNYLSETTSPRFISNVTPRSPSIDSVSQDEESTTAATIVDDFPDSFNYITMITEEDFDDTEDTEPDDNSTIEHIDDETDIQVTVD